MKKAFINIDAADPAKVEDLFAYLNQNFDKFNFSTYDSEEPETAEELAKWFPVDIEEYYEQYPKTIIGRGRVSEDGDTDPNAPLLLDVEIYVPEWIEKIKGAQLTSLGLNINNHGL